MLEHIESVEHYEIFTFSDIITAKWRVTKCLIDRKREIGDNFFSTL